MKWIMKMNAEEHSCIDESQLIESEQYVSEGRKWMKGFIEWISPTQNNIKVPINDVLIAPDRKQNVISLDIIMKKGFHVIYKNNKCSIYRNGKMILEGERINEQYVIETKEISYEYVTNLTISEQDEHSVDMENLECISVEPTDWKGITRLSEEEKNLWINAMKIEMECMTRNKVLEEQIPDEQDKVIGSRWVYSVKYTEKGTVSKIKARLVAMGCHQREGIDYDETYAPVVSHVTIRALLTLAAKNGLYIKHCDITSAFLYGDLEERIFMKIPKCNEVTTRTFLLKKAIYGLKQAAFSWHEKIGASLRAMGYLSNKIDSCLYRKDHNEVSSFVLIHVDDLLFVSEQEIEIQGCVNTLSQEYLIKDLGEAKKYLGMYLDRDRDNQIIYLHQIPMLKIMIQEYGMDNCRPTYSPMISDYMKAQHEQNSPELPDNFLFQKVIGSLLYFGIISRPDIHTAVNILSRNTAHPRQCDWESVKRIVRYLNTTLNYKLKLGGAHDLILSTYCDADWGGEIKTRRSTSGQLHYLGDGLIEWKAKRQNCISLSTAEAEFVAAAEAVQTLTWIHELVNVLKIPIQLPTTVFTDNQSCLKMTESAKVTKHTKHIDVKYYYLKDMSAQGVIRMTYCPSEDMLADIMTKPLGRTQHNKLTLRLGLVLGE